MSSFINRLYFFAFLSLFGLVLNAQDDINITSPHAGDVYAGDILSVSLSYASPDSGYSSPRWSYSTSSYGWQSSVESYSTSVGSSQWLNDLFDGYDSTRTLYVRLLDQANGTVLASDQRTFTYRSGSDINVTAPTNSTVGAGDALSVSFSYASSVGSYSTPRWAYKIGSNYNISSTGTEVNAMSVPGSQWLNGLTHGQSSTVYLALLHPTTGDELAYAQKYFNFSTFDGSDINITSPSAGDVYAGDDLSVSLSYASPDSGYSSPRWAYSTSSYGWQSSVESYSTSVGSSQWLNDLFDGYDSTRTLYVRLLDQANGTVLASDQRTFTYRSGSAPTQTETGGTGGGSVDSISIQKPTSGENVNSGTDELRINYTYSSASGGTQSPTWAYKLYDPNYGTPFSSYSSSHGGTQVNNMVSKYDFMSGQSDGQYTVYVTLLDSSGDMFNPPIVDHVSFGYQSSTGGTQSGGGDYQTPTSGLLGVDDINITSPSAGDVYAGDDLSVSLSYASPDSGYSSPRWSYSSSASSYQSSSQIYDSSVPGSQWLNEVFNAHDETRTIYVHLLNQSTGSILASDSRVYTYRDGTVSPQSSDSNFDLIKVKTPDVPYLSGLSGNDLEIEWHYASPSGGSSSPHWSYKIDNASYSSPQSNTLVPGSAWLGGLSDGWHTLYVSLLDQGSGSQELARASHAFNYQSSGSGIQSPDSISIVYPDVSYLFTSDSNGLEVNFNYQSISGGEQSLSWAYSLDGGAYSSPVSGTRHVTGPTWLSGLNYDWHELRVALLDQASGAQLAYASHMFKYESGNAGTQSPTGGTSQDHHNNPPYFSFSSNDLNTLASGASLGEGNYTILKEHNASDSQPFKFAPVFKDSNGYILVEINASVDSSATFAELESYLDSTQIVEQGYVDFMPFDFLPIQRIDVNQSSALLSLSNGYDEIYFQEFNDTQNNTRYWTLSIEEDGNETNKSSLVVDMAGFVYEGNFEDYWYHTFGIAVYAPNTEPEQKHADWNETEYNADSQGISAVLQNHQHDLSFRQMLLVSNLEILENTPAQSTISQFSLSVPRIMGDLNFTVYSDISTVSSALAIDQQGNLRSLTSFDFETSNQISFATRATDPFGRSIEGNFSLTVLNQVEDYDGDGVEDHIDTDDDNDTFSDSIEQQYGFDPRDSFSHPNFPGVSTAEEILLSSGAYRLGGTLLATGGVQVTEYGIRLKQANESIFQIYRAANLGATNSYSLDFGALEIGEDYFYQAYATNLAGTSLGALKKFTTSVEQFWWSSATELSGGWKSSWVGEFLPYENGWIYHVDLGWAFVKPDLLGGIWMWVDDEGWLWSSEEAWPFLWASNTKNWLYPMNVGVRTYLYDYSSESVRSR